MSAELGGGKIVVGVDLGGTKILAGVVGEDNRILGRSKKATPAKEGGPAILNTILEAINESLSGAGLTAADVSGIGIGSPGPLDPATGVILFSANLNVKNFPLAPDVSKAMGKPALLRNDVRVGGYGEFRLGAGRGYSNLLAAFVGTGIGGCVVMDGKLLEGSTGNAGEVGHIPVRDGGPRCGCGSRGCMEAYASRTSITRRIDKAIKRGIPTILEGKFDKKTGRLKSKDIAAAFNARDSVTVREIKRAAYYLGVGLSGLINVFGPEIVIIGGGVGVELGDKFIELVRNAARPRMLVDPDKKIQIVGAQLGDDAGLLGAALMAREAFAS